MKKLWLVLVFAAFLVGLVGGKKVMVPNAVGFGVGNIQGVNVHVFFDKDANVLEVIPSELIEIAVYRSDDKKL